jgi:hypothetical protein
VVPSWNAAEEDRASIVPFRVVPLREIAPTGEVTGAAKRARLRLYVLEFVLSSESTRTSTALVALAANANGVLELPDVTLVKFPDPTRTDTLEFFSVAVGVTVINDTEFATVAL